GTAGHQYGIADVTVEGGVPVRGGSGRRATGPPPAGGHAPGRPAPVVRLDHRLAAARRQRGGQDDRRYSVGGEPLQSPVEVAAHVHVIGVRLVDDDHLAGEAEVPQHQVTRSQRREQELVDGADDERREHRLLPPAEPPVYSEFIGGEWTAETVVVMSIL